MAENNPRLSVALEHAKTLAEARIGKLVIKGPPRIKLPDGVVEICKTPGCTRKVEWNTTLGICLACWKRQRRAAGLDNYTESNRIRAWTRQGIAWTNATIGMYACAETCDLCGQPFKPGRDKTLDHNHETGEPRGVLCTSCNQGLGRFHDSPALLEKAAAYLRDRQFLYRLEKQERVS
jgi:hypothetical protein